MPVRPTPPARNAAPLPVAALEVLAELADARAADQPGLGFLLRVVAPDGGDHGDVELGWLPLPGMHPVWALAGRREAWLAVGIVAAGRAHHLDDRHRDPWRVRATHLVGCDGAWAHRWSGEDGGPGDATSGGAGAPRNVVGRIDDACRRVLGLPTAEPEEGSGALHALQWLDAIVANGSRSRAAVATWPAVAALHPAVAALQPDGRASGPPDPELLGRLAHRLATWRDWPVLRRSCAAGAWSMPEMDAETAAWLDDGAFSRWVLGAFPDRADLRDAVGDLVPPPVAAAIGRALGASGVRW